MSYVLIKLSVSYHWTKFQCHQEEDFLFLTYCFSIAGEMTTPPPMVIQAGPSVITDTGSSSSMLYVVLGAVLGGLGLLLGLCLLVFLCNRNSQQTQEGSHNASHDPHGKNQIGVLLYHIIFFLSLLIVASFILECFFF